jgi:hypothetical protein
MTRVIHNGVLSGKTFDELNAGAGDMADQNQFTVDPFRMTILQAANEAADEIARRAP